MPSWLIGIPVSFIISNNRPVLIMAYTCLQPQRLLSLLHRPLEKLHWQSPNIPYKKGSRCLAWICKCKINPLFCVVLRSIEIYVRCAHSWLKTYVLAVDGAWRPRKWRKIFVCDTHTHTHTHTHTLTHTHTQSLPARGYKPYTMFLSLWMLVVLPIGMYSYTNYEMPVSFFVIIC
jgi:hypothetical protein